MAGQVARDGVRRRGGPAAPQSAQPAVIGVPRLYGRMLRAEEQ